MPTEEILLPFPCPRDAVPIATRFKSTWLSTSIALLRERGHLATYLRHLPREHHEAVVQSGIGSWLPVEVALAHYEACDALALPEAEQLDIGREAALRVHGPVLRVGVRLAASAGVTPWSTVAKVRSNFERIWIGSAAAVYKLGPKEARFELAGWPCARMPYCRVALRGSLHALTELFAKRVYVAEIPRLRSDLTLGYRIAWA